MPSGKHNLEHFVMKFQNENLKFRTLCDEMPKEKVNLEHSVMKYQKENLI